MKLDRPELFLIHSGCIEAATPDEVDATITSMEELGIAKLPHIKTDIETDVRTFYIFTLKILHRDPTKFEQELINLNPTNGIRFRFEENSLTSIFFTRNGSVHKEVKGPNELLLDLLSSLSSSKMQEFLSHTGNNPLEEGNKIVELINEKAYFYRDLLIVLLATKNIVKVRKENKALRLGIGSKNEFKPIYTTTLTLPSPDQMETVSGAATTPGRSPRPHLRRGHIRNQHYGPKNTLTKQIWIPPMFVNADETFVSTREAYNISQKEPSL